MNKLTVFTIISSGILSTQCGPSESTSTSQENTTICTLEVDQGIYDNELKFLLGIPLKSFHVSVQNDPNKSESLGADLSTEGSDQNVNKGTEIKINLPEEQVSGAFTNDTTYINFGTIISQNENGLSASDLLDRSCKKGGKLKVSEMTPPPSWSPTRNNSTVKFCALEIDQAPFEGIIGKSWQSLSFFTANFTSAFLPVENTPNGVVDIGDQIALFDTTFTGSATQADGAAEIKIYEKTSTNSSLLKLIGSCTKDGLLKVSAMKSSR